MRNLTTLKSSIFHDTREDYYLSDTEEESLFTNPYSFLYDPTYIPMVDRVPTSSTSTVKDDSYITGNCSTLIVEKVREGSSKKVEENQEFVLVEPWKRLTRVNRESGTTIFRDNENEGKRWIYQHEYQAAFGKMVRALGRVGEDYYDALGEAYVIYAEIKAKEESVSKYTGEIPKHPMSYYVTRIRNEMVRVYRKQEMLKRWSGQSDVDFVGYEENDGLMNDPLIDIVEAAELETYRDSLTPTKLKTFMELEKALDDDPEVEFDSNFRRKVARLPKVSRDYSESKLQSGKRPAGPLDLRDDEAGYNFPVKTTRIRKW